MDDELTFTMPAPPLMDFSDKGKPLSKASQDRLDKAEPAPSAPSPE